MLRLSASKLSKTLRFYRNHEIAVIFDQGFTRKLGVISILLLGWVASARADLAHEKSSPKSGPAVAEICREIGGDDQGFIACVFDGHRDDVRLFWKDRSGEPLTSIPGVMHSLQAHGQNLVFAMAGGMFHSDSTPVGLYLERGRELHAINREEGEGNFFSKPNGVLYFNQTTTRASAKYVSGILETEAYFKSKPKSDYAVQSGPILVMNGEVLAKFQEGDPMVKPRSGVGVNRHGQLVFAFSKTTSNFYRFASLFRNQLDCPNALHLDSTSVSVFVPSLGRLNQWLPIGPIIGVVQKAK